MRGFARKWQRPFCAGLEIAHTAGWLELTQHGIQKPSKGALSGIPEVTDNCPTSSATSIPVSPLTAFISSSPLQCGPVLGAQ